MVQVTYDQASLDQRGTYIITTTKDWRRPLTFAVYRIFPHGVRIKTSSYELTLNKDGYLSFERRDLMPAVDRHFSWEPTIFSDRGGIQ